MPTTRTRSQPDVSRRDARLREALEQQSATAEILRVIRAFPSDPQPVFEAIVQAARKLGDARDAYAFQYDGQNIRAAASTDRSPENRRQLAELGSRVPDPISMCARVIAARAPLALHDIGEDAEYRRVTGLTVHGRRLAMPMLKEAQVIGILVVAWDEAGEVPERFVRLLHTFADQAVIAVENARLFRALEQERQTLEQRVAEQVAQIERLARLRRFVSPRVADLILAGQMEDPMATRRREVCVLFVDLRGFTQFSETAAPEDVLHVLRQYHAEIGERAMRYDATVEHFAGDGVMLVLNDPATLPAPALCAVRMAVELRDGISEAARGWRRMGHRLGCGFGIAQGYATIGTIGFPGRYDYGVIGVVANLAARLCAHAASGQVLVSERVYAAVDGLVDAEPAGALELKGFHAPVEAFNVLACRPAAAA